MRRDFMRKKRNGSSTFKQLDDDELTTMEEVPEELEQRAEALFTNDEEIKVAVSTDLKFDGNYGKDWLIATDRRLIALIRTVLQNIRYRKFRLRRFRLLKSLRCTVITS